jgi:hypothetical protein
MTLFLRRFLTVSVSAAAMTVISSGLPLVAQEPNAPQTESKTKARTGKRVFDPSRRVPMYFGQLGLSEDQREAIYKIQGKHLPKIETLEKEIDGIRAQMLKDCEGVLTPAQSQLLEQRRAGAETRSRKGTTSKTQP